jgi:hypothetical protein
VRSGSFHRQKVQRLAGKSCKREQLVKVGTVQHRDHMNLQSSFDKRVSLKREKAFKRDFSVRSDSFHRQNCNV